MADLIVPEGTPDIVNLSESRVCFSCGNRILKRKQMWKFSDGNYMCIPCKTRFDADQTKGVDYSAIKEGAN
jgi:DNA-directed RNA polymerase subunit RPC12/RpoP